MTRDTARVLLATEIADHAHAYQATLLKRGLHVDVARSGKEALELARAHRPDCAVIDLRLPDMSGWTLCGTMKASPLLRDVPVVVLTPDISTDHVAQGVAAGCHAWLARPTVADDLARVIAHVLAQGRGRPASPDDALVGNEVACPTCASRRVRATLRLASTQYYRCIGCGCFWKTDFAGIARAG